MSKHTPGPWFENAVPTSVGSAITIHSANHRIAIIYVDGIRKGIDDELPRSIENRANARLIAAAPELLEALQDLCSFDLLTQEKWDKARAAIAKATGENHAE